MLHIFLNVEILHYVYCQKYNVSAFCYISILSANSICFTADQTVAPLTRGAGRKPQWSGELISKLHKHSCHCCTSIIVKIFSSSFHPPLEAFGFDVLLLTSFGFSGDKLRFTCWDPTGSPIHSFPLLSSVSCKLIPFRVTGEEAGIHAGPTAGPSLTAHSHWRWRFLQLA